MLTGVDILEEGSFGSCREPDEPTGGAHLSARQSAAAERCPDRAPQRGRHRGIVRGGREREPFGE
jgi:hypothetical protein